MTSLKPDVESLARTVPGIIYRIELPEVRVVFVNDTIEDVCGYSASEFMSQRATWMNIVYHEDRQMLQRTIESDQKRFFSIEYRICHRDGGLRWVLNRATTIWENDEPKWRDGIILDITAQKNTELALKQRDQMLKWSSQTAKIGWWEINVQKESAYWSEEIFNIHDIDQRMSVDAVETLSYYSPELRPMIRSAVDKGVADGRPWDLEMLLTTVRGNKKWVRDIGIPEIVNGKCIALRGVLQDITENKNTAEALKQKEQELELAIENAGLGIWEIQVGSQTLYFSNHGSLQHGYQPEELNGASRLWESLIHPEDRRHMKRAFHDHIAGVTSTYQSEYRIMRKDGNWMWILDRGKVTRRDEDGRAIRLSGTHVDITDQKHIELDRQKLQAELEAFKAAIDASTIVSIADTQGVIVYANSKFEQISQYSVDELIGSRHNIVNSGYHPRSFWRDMWQTVSKGRIWRAEVKNKRKDGTYYWVDTFIIPLKGHDQTIERFLSIRNDITEKKENEIKLHEALIKAEESDRLKSQFLANISHEIRTPMNAILGFAELLDRPHLTPAKRSEFSQLIQQRGADLLTIVNDILDVSKIEAGQFSPVPIKGNIGDVLDQLQRTFNAENSYLKKKQLTLTVVNNLAGKQNEVFGDFLRLNQVLANLLTNAAKFTDAGTIEFGCSLQDPNNLLFWVRDTGIGIDQEQSQVIFMPFRQAHDSIHQQYGGSGLGLAICKGIVELWQGKIWFESERGKGTTFFFTMPFNLVGNTVVENSST